MNVYKITAEVQVDDGMGEEDIVRLIDRDMNRCDGIYLDVTSAKVELLRMDPDED